MATLEILEQRVISLEQAVTRLDAELSREPAVQPPPNESRGARMIREAKQGHAAAIAASEKVMKDLGIEGQPIGAKVEIGRDCVGCDNNESAGSL